MQVHISFIPNSLGRLPIDISTILGTALQVTRIEPHELSQDDWAIIRLTNAFVGNSIGL
jgi:hypothetical protein